MSDTVAAISDSSFDEDVIKAQGPVLVDFWAEWCGPCKQIAPILAEVAEKYKDKIRIVKLDVDKNPESARQYGVRGIPTLMLFKNGENVDTKVGALSDSELTAFIEENL